MRPTNNRHFSVSMKITTSVGDDNVVVGNDANARLLEPSRQGWARRSGRASRRQNDVARTQSISVGQGRHPRSIVSQGLDLNLVDGDVRTVSKVARRVQERVDRVAQLARSVEWLIRQRFFASLFSRCLRLFKIAAHGRKRRHEPVVSCVGGNAAVARAETAHCLEAAGLDPSDSKPPLQQHSDCKGPARTPADAEPLELLRRNHSACPELAEGYPDCYSFPLPESRRSIP